MSIKPRRVHQMNHAYPGVIEAELRAVTRRLAELNDYWERLDADRARLERARTDAVDAAARAAEALTPSTLAGPLSVDIRDVFDSG